MRTLPDLPVFSSTDAAQHGWSRSALRHAVATGRVARIRRDVYAVAGPHDPARTALAVERAYRHAVISHRSAALLHGLPLLGSGPPVPEVTVPPRANVNHHDAHPYRARLRDCDIVTIDGALTTSVARTLSDLARHRPVHAAVVSIDAALHTAAVKAHELDDALHWCRTWPRSRRARLAVQLSDHRAESPLESISRLVLPRVGIPAPDLQQPIFDHDGVLVARCDFYWNDVGVVGEADGRHKYDDRAVLWAEKQRQERLEALGLVVVRWGWDDAYRHPHRLAARLQQSFERGRLRDRSGFPRQWSL